MHLTNKAFRCMSDRRFHMRDADHPVWRCMKSSAVKRCCNLFLSSLAGEDAPLSLTKTISSGSEIRLVHILFISYVLYHVFVFSSSKKLELWSRWSSQQNGTMKVCWITMESTVKKATKKATWTTHTSKTSKKRRTGKHRKNNLKCRHEQYMSIYLYTYCTTIPIYISYNVFIYIYCSYGIYVALRWLWWLLFWDQRIDFGPKRWLRVARALQVLLKLNHTSTYPGWWWHGWRCIWHAEWECEPRPWGHPRGSTGLDAKIGCSLLPRKNLLSQWHACEMWIVQNTSHLTSCDIAARFLKCFVSASDSTKFIRRFDRCFIEIETYPGKQENIDGPSAVLDSCRVEIAGRWVRGSRWRDRGKHGNRHLLTAEHIGQFGQHILALQTRDLFLVSLVYSWTRTTNIIMPKKTSSNM